MTVVREIRNHCADVARVRSVKSGREIVCASGETQRAVEDMPIPWCTSAAEFSADHIDVFVGSRRYAIWQADRGGADLVRVSAGGWHDPGDRIGGVAVVGPLIPNPLRLSENARTLIVNDSGVFLLPQETIEFIAWLKSGNVALRDGYRICTQGTRRSLRGEDPEVIRSVPKSRATAFSMGGVPSDAFDRGEREARLRYRDSGKRYEFWLENGAVRFSPAVKGKSIIDEVDSYSHARAGVTSAAPSFDLIAASGGRVFAKEKDRDRFYFARLDAMFIHVRADGSEFEVPSTYFKLDPEFNQAGASRWDLLRRLAGDYAGHPAGERFNFFRLLLDFGVTESMTVNMRRGVWHLLDLRPPVKPDMMAAPSPTDMAIPEWAPGVPIPIYDLVGYCSAKGSVTAPDIVRPSFDYRRVLDIGVGHLHFHDQYESITGGELQPLRTAAANLLNVSSAYFPPVAWAMLGQLVPLAPLVPTVMEQLTYADGYRLFNGPVRDGDGHIDGTCNYYALVELANGTYALLYADEQSFFTHRWRLVHPDDFHHLGFSLAIDLDADLRREPSRQVYGWKPENFWCPFRQPGHIVADSRLAVAAQVLLVNGEFPEAVVRDQATGAADRSKAAVIYSINFSFATMDRSWRWRRLPAAARYYDPAASGGADPAPVPGPDCVYPQSIRLREDMTLHLKGVHQNMIGRWYQRYLPADNVHVPAAGQLRAGERPQSGYRHPWKFVAEDAFQRADAFSHFGVYDEVDSRTQYYVLEPVTATDAQYLDAAGPGPWLDDNRQLFVNTRTANGVVNLPFTVKFPWDTLRIGVMTELPLTILDPILDLLAHPLHWGPELETTRLASLYNPEARLRIVRRGASWVAMHWDKRDNDLMSYFLPADGSITVELRNGATRARVRLTRHRWIEQPPVVQRAYFWWDAKGAAALAFATSRRADIFENVWRMRMAAFVDPAASADVVHLLDAAGEGSFTRIADGVYVHRWTLTAADAARLRHYCTGEGAFRFGTSIWFEDVTGHVSLPEQIRWLHSPTMRVSVTPAAIPLGIPTSVTVHAVDAETAAVVTGDVDVDGTPIGRTNVAIGNTFNSQVLEEYDPETRLTTRQEILPTGTVVAEGYVAAEIPFVFYKPKLTLRVQPPAVQYGLTGQTIIVYADDSYTHQPVAAPITLGGRVVGTSNSPFSFLFLPGQSSGAVNAPGYPEARFAVSPLRSDAIPLTQSVPASMVTGQRHRVSLTMRNTGLTTWVPGAWYPFRLGAQNPHDNVTWGTNRVELSAPVAPGADVTFTFDIVAPAPGIYHFQWRMVQELVQWFGAPSPDVAIQVMPLALQVAITPYPVPLNTSVQARVNAVSNATGLPVDGDVLVNGTRVAATNVTFTYIFRPSRTRVWDAEVGAWIYEIVYPTVMVRAAGYPDAPVDLGMSV